MEKNSAILEILSLSFLKDFIHNETLFELIRSATLLTFLLLFSFFLLFLLKKILLNKIENLALKTKIKFDNILYQQNVFRKFVMIFPLLFFYSAAVYIKFKPEILEIIVKKILLLIMIFQVSRLFHSVLNSLKEFYNNRPLNKDKPLKSFFQTLIIVIYFIASIIGLSVILNKNPAYFLTGLGAGAAVLMLVFKDSILGFTASIQMAANKIVRIGDWIEMPRHGADGEVTDISLTSVKIQNWDKTITSIPPYEFVTGSVKNWRGMSEGGGRRIKRALRIDMSSIRFCDEDMINRFKEIRYVKDYINRKHEEINRYNRENQISYNDFINGRRLTNIGTLRAYITTYLKNHPMIADDMTFLIRQLAPSDTGLPLEIYVFCKDKRWSEYEKIQADIFDHILAIVPEFDLKIFQNPAGSDLKETAGIFLNTPGHES